MSAVVGIVAALFIFGFGVRAGWRTAGNHDDVDRRLLVLRRDEQGDE